MDKQVYNTAVLGAGASGLFAAGLLKGGKIIIEGNKKPGLKVLVSGGGACNFGNRAVSGTYYFGQNPRFCLSALAGFGADGFAALLRQNKIPFAAREDGKLFARSAADILDFLLSRIDGEFAFNNHIKKVNKSGGIFEIITDKNIFYAKNVICALGGLSYPALGAGGAAYDIAKDFGLALTPRYPALTGIIFDKKMKETFAPLAGISCAAKLKCGRQDFAGDILFTHGGLSGPAVLQASLYGIKNKEISIDFLPGFDVCALLAANKTSPQKPSALLHGKLPARLLQVLTGQNDKQLANLNKKEIAQTAAAFNNFTFTVKEICGYDKAEITAGGVDTKGISSQTMQTVNVPGLYFTGEALDISGRLGGYNLHWAWASAAAAARAINLVK